MDKQSKPGQQGSSPCAYGQHLERVKRHSRPSNPVFLPSVGLGCDDDDITKQLEETMRKISRGSPSGYSWISHMPRHGVGNQVYLSDPTCRRTGFSVLTRGYEQYRESLLNLRPTTEFGEASSDDLSSEWESCSESELPPATNFLKITNKPISTTQTHTSNETAGTRVRVGIKGAFWDTRII